MANDGIGYMYRSKLKEIAQRKICKGSLLNGTKAWITSKVYDDGNTKKKGKETRIEMYTSSQKKTKPRERNKERKALQSWDFPL